MSISSTLRNKGLNSHKSSRIGFYGLFLCNSARKRLFHKKFPGRLQTREFDYLKIRVITDSTTPKQSQRPSHHWLLGHFEALQHPPFLSQSTYLPIDSERDGSQQERPSHGHRPDQLEYEPQRR